MNDTIVNYILPLGIFSILLIAFIYIINFFSLSTGVYFGYILWFVGLAIFYFILPKTRPSKFIEN